MALCSRGAPYFGYMGPSGLWFGWLPCLALQEAPSHWKTGSGHKAAGHMDSGGPGVVLVYWWAEMCAAVGECGAGSLRSSVGLLVGRIGF